MAAGLLQRATNKIDLKAPHLIVEVDTAPQILHRADTVACFGSTGNRLRIANLRPQTLARNLVAGGDDNRPFNRILKLSYIARPRVSFEQRQHLGSDLLRHLAAVLFVILLDKVLGHGTGVMPPAAQRWRFD